MKRKCEWTKRIDASGGTEIIPGTCHGFFQFQDRDEAEPCAIFEFKEGGQVKTVAPHKIRFVEEIEIEQHCDKCKRTQCRFLPGSGGCILVFEEMVTDCEKCHHGQPCSLEPKSKECGYRFRGGSSHFPSN